MPDNPKPRSGKGTIFKSNKPVDPKTFNPFDAPGGPADADALAAALVPASDTTNDHFEKSAKHMVEGLILATKLKRKSRAKKPT